MELLVTGTRGPERPIIQAPPPSRSVHRTLRSQATGSGSWSFEQSLIRKMAEAMVLVPRLECRRDGQVPSTTDLQMAS